jgi:hypothetical protein
MAMGAFERIGDAPLPEQLSTMEIDLIGERRVKATYLFAAEAASCLS